MAEYTDDQIDAYGRQTRDSSYTGWDVTFNTEAAKVGRANIRKTLQAKAEQDTANAELNTQKARQLSMANDLNQEILDTHTQGIQQIKQRDFHNQTLQFIQASHKDGDYTSAYNTLVTRNPEIKSAMANLGIMNVHNFNSTDSRHNQAFKDANMPQEIIDNLAKMHLAIWNGEQRIKESGGELTPEEVTAKKQMRDISMAYPVVETPDGKFKVGELGAFIGATGLLKGMYSTKDKEELLKQVDNGMVALQGIAQSTHLSKLAKEKAEAGKLDAESGKLGEETSQLKSQNDMIKKIYEGGGTLEEKQAQILKIIDPKGSASLQTAQYGADKAKVELKTAEANLKKTGVETQLKTMEVQEKKTENQVAVLGIKDTISAANQGLAQIEDVLALIPKNYDSATGKWLAGFYKDSKSSELGRALGTLDAKGFLASIQGMKGFGALSDAEGKKLSVAIANLERDQTSAELIKNVNILKQFIIGRRTSMVARLPKSSTTKQEAPVVSNTSKYAHLEAFRRAQQANGGK